MTNETKPNVGVIVGRFQVPSLHAGHIDLIEQVKNNVDRVIIFLGITTVKCSMRNPLDYETRRAMINAKYPSIQIYPISDESSDSYWSEVLDRKISEIIPGKESVVLYGSRDSFTEHYKGARVTQDVETTSIMSGSVVREDTSRSPAENEGFRKGVVYASNNRYPISYQTVDAVIWKEVKGIWSILLGRKRNEDKFRMPGGFVDPTDKSLEMTIRREVSEECGDISLNSVYYAGSYRVDDWRYRGEADKIMTTVFNCVYLCGRPEPGDDLHELRWFAVEDILCHIHDKDLMDVHKSMIKDAIYYNKPMIITKGANDESN